MSRIRVLLADDHAILREGLRALLGGTDDIEVVGEAANGEETITQVAALRPDVVVMDVAMPGLGGLEATLALRRAHPDVRVLVLTQHENPEYVRRFMKAGASGYLLKRTAGSELASAIRAARQGGLVLDPAIARSALVDPAAGGDPPAYEQLTPREKQVLKLVAEGLSNKDIAEHLDISVKTAMTHREHLMQKLNLHSRAALIRYAIREGVITVGD
ncbi:MAG: response regulator [Vicinamibacterales bacterium]